MFNKNKGFTLVELLVVIAIIGILAAIVIVNLVTAQDKAKDAQAEAYARNAATALEMYEDDENGYPATVAWTAGTILTGPTSGENYIAAFTFPSGTSGAYTSTVNTEYDLIITTNAGSFACDETGCR